MANRVCFIESFVDRALFISFGEPKVLECNDINDLVESLAIPSTLESIVQGSHWVTKAIQDGDGYMEGDITSVITKIG